MKRKAFWRKAIPIVIVFLFVVVSFSPIYTNSNGTSSIHGNSAKNNPQVNSPSSNLTFAGYVKYTLLLSNNSLLNGNVANPFNGKGPSGVAYDPSNGHMYVTNEFSNNVGVINTTTDRVVDGINVGTHPSGITYDPSNGHMYVANEWSDNVSVINTTTNTVIKNIAVGSQPTRIAYDFSDQNMYVTNYYSNNVSVINSTTDVAVNSIIVGHRPYGIAYDPVNQTMYVTNFRSDNITVINTTTNKVVQNINNITCGYYLSSIAYNPANGYMYVIDAGDSHISVINTTTNTVVKTMLVYSSPRDIAYDPVNKYMYVTDVIIGSNCRINSILLISSVNGCERSSIVGSNPDGIAYDPSSQTMYVANSGSNNVSVIKTTNDIVTNTVINNIDLAICPYDVAYDPANGYMYVAHSNKISLINGTTGKFLNNTTIFYSAMDIAYDPANNYTYITIPYYGDLMVINSTTGKFITYLSPSCKAPRGVAYDPVNKYMYSTTSPRIYQTNTLPNGTIVMLNSTNNIVGNITVGICPSGVAFDPSNGYMYVVNSGSNNVTVINSTTDTIVKNIAVGSDPTSIAYDNSNGYMYVVNSGSNNVTVINSTTDTIVKNIAVGSDPTSIAYDNSNGYMYVVNSGSDSLSVINSNKVIWGITVGSDPTSIAYDNSTGYMYVANRGSGSLSIISNGYTDTATYKVKFTESGLPSGTTWYVKLNKYGMLSSSTTSTISFNLINGSYSYSIGHVYGYSSNLTVGDITLNGSSVNVNALFYKNVAPVWAFDGAYLNYTYTYPVNSTKSISGYIYEGILGVNTNYGTANISTICYLKENESVPSTYEENNTSLNSFSYAYNSIELSMLNNGKIPATMNDSFEHNGLNETISISVNISLNTGMGTFLTDRIEYTTISGNITTKLVLYVDRYSGVMLGMTDSFYSNTSSSGAVNITLLLHSTNVPLSYHSSILKINVSPHDASVTVNGIYSQLTSGNASLSLSPGSYNISISSPGYVTVLKEVNMTGRTEYLNVTLKPSTPHIYNISGFVLPANASIMFYNTSVPVNSSGYYNISLTYGTYIVSVTDNGYFSYAKNITINKNMSDLNFTLIKEPKPTSSQTISNINATGYNVTISKIMLGNGNISVNYTATSNGTITVALPYSQVKNATISNLLSSKIYINGIQYKNFTVAISSSGTVILTVYNLTGDPTLVWQYSHAASMPPPAPTPTPKPSPVSSAISSIEIYAIIGVVIAIVAVAGVVMVMRKKK